VRLDAEFGGDGRPLDHAREARAVSGAPRSDTNTNGDCSLSRRCLRSARISRPVNGCVAGVPFLTRRTVIRDR
jgi:hypothetical protein